MELTSRSNSTIQNREIKNLRIFFYEIIVQSKNDKNDGHRSGLDKIPLEAWNLEDDSFIRHITFNALIPDLDHAGRQIKSPVPGWGT
jgi:hypothetical protein